MLLDNDLRPVYDLEKWVGIVTGVQSNADRILAMDGIALTAEELLGPLNDVETKHAPSRLFVRGNRDILTEGAPLSIVGSREASAEGLARARRLATALVNEGHVVVSGLARGIDTAAHEAAIEGGGWTVGVVGTPLNKAYPRENADLQESIALEHLLVSQFPVGTATKPAHFPQRNRTMALMSDVTVIVEAGESSGSLHQGWEALRLGRGLFITKAVAENPNLKWPASMIGYGAEVLSDETLEEFFDRLPLRTKQLADAIPDF